MTGAGTVIIRTANTRNEKALKTDRFPQILQLEQQRWTRRQITTFAFATLRRLTRPHFQFRRHFRRLCCRFDLIGFAGFVSLAGFTGMTDRCDDFRRFFRTDVGDGEVEFVGVFDQGGQSELPQVE